MGLGRRNHRVGGGGHAGLGAEDLLQLLRITGRLQFDQRVDDPRHFGVVRGPQPNGAIPIDHLKLIQVAGLRVVLQPIDRRILTQFGVVQGQGQVAKVGHQANALGFWFGGLFGTARPGFGRFLSQDDDRTGQAQRTNQQPFEHDITLWANQGKSALPRNRCLLHGTAPLCS